MGPLPPPEAVAAYQRIDPRFVDAIRESLEIQNRNDAENGATIRRNLERMTDLRFEEQTLRKEERRDDIRTRRDNRTLIVGISVGWVVLFLVVLFAPPLTAGTRAWVLVALCGLAAAPIIAIVVRGRISPGTPETLAAASRYRPSDRDGQHVSAPLPTPDATQVSDDAPSSDRT